MLLQKEPQMLGQAPSYHKKTSYFSTLLNFQKIFFKLMFVLLSLMCLSCRYTPELRSRNVDNIGNTPLPTNPGNPTTPGSGGGTIVSDCNQNADYNACIYEKNPIAQSGTAINYNSALSQLTQMQTYAVQITGTEGDLLKNSHFDVDVDGDISPGVISTIAGAIINNVNIVHLLDRKFYIDSNMNAVERVRLSNGKWTTPYSDGDLSVEQAMSYYWLMYQHDWMKENASGFYASEKDIKVSAFSPIPFNAYFSPLENKIALGVICDITSNPLSCNQTVGVGLSAEVIIHEAGHANTYHSKSPSLRGGSESDFCQAHVDCKSRKSICDLSEDEVAEAAKCCNAEKGCYFAIDEGAADFHAAILFPNNTAVGEMFQNSVKGLTGCFPSDGLSRNVADSETKSVRVGAVFNGCSNHQGPGEIHLMGILYNSIWWEIYTHTDTEKSDILTLFTEHLPILHYSDDFGTAGDRIINLAKQLFDTSKADKYADIIRDEFSRRGLNL